MASPRSAPSRLRLAGFFAFVVLALLSFTLIQVNIIRERERVGREAFAALFDRQLALKGFRTSPDAQSAFTLADQTHGPPEERRLLASTYILGASITAVEATTRRRNGLWFRDRFQLNGSRKLIENYTCTPLP